MGPDPSSPDLSSPDRLSAELEEERATLDRAERDILDGRGRIARQQATLTDLRAKALDTGHAERLLTLLQETLTQWERHRTLILQRIAYLEARRAGQGAPEPVAEG